LDGFFKLRVGDVRVVYSLDREARLIRIHLVGNRDEIYKRRG
jgi:mRNA-degrading endonuclease RelE of RelBE toxin-antitoxin system